MHDFEDFNIELSKFTTHKRDIQPRQENLKFYLFYIIIHLVQKTRKISNKKKQGSTVS